MIVSSKTNLHNKEMDYGNELTKSELCFRQFKSYLLWTKGCPTDHSSYKLLLGLTRKNYELYKLHKHDDLILAYEDFLDYNKLEVTEVKEIA